MSDLLWTLDAYMRAIREAVGPGSDVWMLDDGDVVAVEQGGRIVARCRARSVELDLHGLLAIVTASGSGADLEVA